MQLSRRQIYAYVAVAAVVLAVGARYVVFPKAAGPAGGEPLVLAPRVPAAGFSGRRGQPVAGGRRGRLRVRRGQVAGRRAPPRRARASPTRWRSPAGPDAKAELAAVNLAAKVVDGQQIMVPERGAVAAGGRRDRRRQRVGGSAGGSAAAPAGAPVNINTASLEELDALDGVGPATAQKIIDYRVASGPFKTIDDIKNVSGIGDAKFAAMKDSITV